MSDTLEIFGQEWTGVTGFKATDDNDTIKTFIRPQGTISISQNGTGIDVSQYASADVAVPSTETNFVVTVSWDSSTSKWTPDKTFAQINEAYTAGKTIALRTNVPVDQAVADGEYIYDGGYDDDWFAYYVIEYDGTGGEKEKVHIYTLLSTGLRYDGTGTYVFPEGTINITHSGNTDVTYYDTANVPAGTAGTPTATKGTVSNHSVSVTPSVTNTTGYITGSTKTGTAVTVSASELVSGSETKTANGTYDVTNLETLVVNVSGGSSKNIQVNSGSNSVRTNGYTSTGHSLTVAKTGTYKVSWTAWRSSSQGTMGTNLHRNSTAGTNQQTWTNTYGQHIVLNNQSYTEGDVLTLYATAGSTSRYCWVAGLTIEEQ